MRKKEPSSSGKKNSPGAPARGKNGKDLICRFLRDGTILFVNRAYCRYFEKSLKDLIGKNFYPFIPEKDRKRVRRNIDSLSAGSPVMTHEHRVLKPDGEIGWQQWTNLALFDDTGRITGYQSVGRDITEQKQTYEALKKSSEKYQVLFENANDAVFLHLQTPEGLPGRFIESNEAATKLFGYTKKELLNLSPIDLENPDKALDNPAIAEKLKRSKKIIFEREVYTKAGDTIPVEISSHEFPLHGKPVVMSIVRNITKRKKAEKALRENEEQFRLLSEQSILGIFIIQNNTIQYVNQGVTDICEYSREEILGWGPGEYIRLVHPEDREFVAQQARKKQEGEKDVVIRHNWRGLTKTGKLKWVESFSKTVTFRGQPADFVTLIDITEQKKAEEILKRYMETIEELVAKRTNELMETQQELEKAKRLSELGALSAAVAHELRNPMGVIRTAAYNIRKKSQSPRLEKHISNIEKKIQESDRIISNLLSYSRIKKPRYEKIRILTLLKECTAAVKKRFPKQPFAVEIRKSSSVAEWIEVDPVLIREIFDNIMTNAFQSVLDLQSVHEKKGSLTIRIASKGKTITITFRDNGRGMDREDLERAFDAFFTKKPKGMGLGLTICRELVLLHAGEIDIHSVKGRGTTVTLRLPIEKPPDDKDRDMEKSQ